MNPLENLYSIIKENSDSNGYAENFISLPNILLNFNCSTPEDIIEIIEAVELVNSHNIGVYLNMSMTKEDATRHSDNILNNLSYSTSEFVRLKRMANGL